MDVDRLMISLDARWHDRRDIALDRGAGRGPRRQAAARCEHDRGDALAGSDEACATAAGVQSLPVPCLFGHHIRGLLEPSAVDFTVNGQLRRPKRLLTTVPSLASCAWATGRLTWASTISVRLTGPRPQRRQLPPHICYWPARLAGRTSKVTTNSWVGWVSQPRFFTKRSAATPGQVGCSSNRCPCCQRGAPLCSGPKSISRSPGHLCWLILVAAVARYRQVPRFCLGSAVHQEYVPDYLT
jgi:hypothetical protein